MILTGTQERDCSVAVSELFGFGNLIKTTFSSIFEVTNCCRKWLVHFWTPRLEITA